MKKISLWARNHVVITRTIIVFIHCLLILIAYYLSNNTAFDLPLPMLVIIGFIVFGSAIVYPFTKKHSYELQKAVLFITSTGFFLIMCFFFKHNFQLPGFQNSLSAVSLPVDTLKAKSTIQKIESPGTSGKRTLTKAEKHTLKKQLLKEVKSYKKLPKPQRPTGQDALLIFLIVLSGLGLLFCLSILVCGISCGGVPALAIVLSSLGAGGIGVGLYFIIRRLRKNIDMEMKKEKNSTGKTGSTMLWLIHT